MQCTGQITDGLIALIGMIKKTWQTFPHFKAIFDRLGTERKSMAFGFAG